jgi:tRNA(Ile)-lysidine synthase
MELLDQFESYCRKHGLFRFNDKILLGVSGGVDSMVLMDLFCRIHTEFCLSLAVVHLNHGLRGDASDADEQFVKHQSKEYGVSFYSKKAEVLDFAESEKRSVEEAARILRFQYFNDLLARLQFDKIALGHQADDQAETILLHLVRGAGLAGTTGIRSINGNIIHPLLFATRKEIESYAAFRGLEYRTDQSNLDLTYRRNRMRWDILQNLKIQFGNGIVRTICRFGQIALETQAFIDHEAEKVFSDCARQGRWGEIVLDIFPFLSYFRAVQKAILLKIAAFFDEDAVLNSKDYDRLFEFIDKGKSGRKAFFSNQIEAVKSGQQVVFITRKRGENEGFPVSIGEWVDLKAGMRFRATVQDAAFQECDFKLKSPYIEYFDYEKIAFPLKVRYSQPGDAIVPLGMHHSKKLKAFFIDQKIPNYLRRIIPLLADSKSLLWVIGVRMHDRVKITPATRTVLKVEVKI